MKHLKLTILFIVCLAIYIIYINTKNNNISYIALGDEFSLGKNSYNKIDYSYTDYLRDYLKENKLLNNYTKNYSKEEYKINDLYNDILVNKSLKLNKNIRKDLRDSKLLTLSIGTNDLIYKLSLNKSNTIIVKEISNDLEKLIKEIKKYYQYDIYLSSLINIYPNNIYKTDLILKINNKYKNLSRKYNLIYIDVENLYKNSPNLKSNPNIIYPNILGYKEISKKIIDNLCIKVKKTCKI